MSNCGVPHPEHGGACTCDYPHPQHQVWFDGAWRYWPNDAYRPPVPPSSTKDNLQTIKDLSRKSMAAKMPVNRGKNISAPSNGTPTSDAAARRIAPMLRGMKAEIFAVIAEHGPITCDAVEVLTGGKHQTVSARFNDLVKEGRIEDTGESALTRSGFSAALYRVTQ